MDGRYLMLAHLNLGIMLMRASAIEMGGPYGC